MKSSGLTSNGSRSRSRRHLVSCFCSSCSEYVRGRERRGGRGVGVEGEERGGVTVMELVYCGRMQDLEQTMSGC